MSHAGSLEASPHRDDAVQPYTMHVSSRYLELTKQKLELTRLPREVPLVGPDSWQYGTPKAVLEPLIDYWLEQYDWRAREEALNARLPQFRTTLTLSDTEQALASTTETNTKRTQRIHFVHRRSEATNAKPLLYCHGWPGTFLEVSKAIDALTAANATLSFHVVVPSIPGFGFSDASEDPTFGPAATADCFDALMQKLGYQTYVAHGTGRGFDICRLLGVRHPRSCIAIHTVSPRLPTPAFTRSFGDAIKQRIARWTGARPDATVSGSSSEETPTRQDDPTGSTKLLSPTTPYSSRPQTRSYALADSPSGLLACLLDVLRPPHLDVPKELAQAAQVAASPSSSRAPDYISDRSRRAAASPVMEPIRESVETPRPAMLQSSFPAWTATDVLDWTMLMWLPGPESPLRWVDNAVKECSPEARNTLAGSQSPVPLGITNFSLPTTTLGTEPPKDAPEEGSTTAGLEPGRLDAPQGTSSLRRLSPRRLWKAAKPHNEEASAGGGRGGRLSTPPPVWAAPFQDLRWVRRHHQASQTPIWEFPELVVLDMVDFFGPVLEGVDLPEQIS